MTPDEARDEIIKAVRVSRADIVSAKGFLADAGGGRIDTQAQMQAWAQVVSPGFSRDLYLDRSDTEGQVATSARGVMAHLALGAAAWELIYAGVVFQAGTHASWQPQFTWRTSHGGGGLDFRGRLEMVYPESLLRPEWHQVDGNLLDADLYLKRLSAGALHPGVEEAIRLSLDCFRRDLFLPALAMLGAASEGAWVETANALARCHPSDPRASRLIGLLNDSQTSVRSKIGKTCELYDQSTLYESTYAASGVDNRRLHQVAEWSDVVREARNVLHWGTTSIVPNTYEKVAILLMAATSELSALHEVKKAAAN